MASAYDCQSHDSAVTHAHSHRRRTHLVVDVLSDNAFEIAAALRVIQQLEHLGARTTRAATTTMAADAAYRAIACGTSPCAAISAYVVR